MGDFERNSMIIREVVATARGEAVRSYLSGLTQDAPSHEIYTLGAKAYKYVYNARGKSGVSWPNPQDANGFNLDVWHIATHLSEQHFAALAGLSINEIASRLARLILTPHWEQQKENVWYSIRRMEGEDREYREKYGYGLNGSSIGRAKESLLELQRRIIGDPGEDFGLSAEIQDLIEVSDTAQALRRLGADDRRGTHHPDYFRAAAELAAEKGNIEVLQALVAAGFDVTYRNSECPPYHTVLWHAAKAGQLQMVEFLLRAGADPNLGVLPLPIRYASGNFELYQLLRRYGAGLRGMEHELLEYGTPEVIASVLKEGDCPEEDKIDAFTSVAFWAASRSPSEQLPEGLEWIRASLPYHLDRLAAFLSGGVDVNAIDRKGHSALSWAVYCRNREMVEFLFQRGADPNAHGSLVMRTAAWALNLAIAERLLELGADIDARGADGVTALMSMHNLGSSLDMIKLFLRHGADPNAEDAEGLTVLMYYSGSPQVFQLLLDAGANLEATNKDGQTVSDYIAERMSENFNYDRHKETLNVIKSHREKITAVRYKGPKEYLSAE